jgi:hypothetical protein
MHVVGLIKGDVSGRAQWIPLT